MREVDELVPVVRGQLLLFLLYRRAGRDGAITRENPLPQEVGGVGVRMVLEVAIGEPRGDAPRECRHEVLDLQDLHLALHLHSRREPQPDGGDTPNSPYPPIASRRSEEHTSELQSRLHLVCRLLLEKKKKNEIAIHLEASPGTVAFHALHS